MGFTSISIDIPPNFSNICLSFMNRQWWSWMNIIIGSWSGAIRINSVCVYHKALLSLIFVLKCTVITASVIYILCVGEGSAFAFYSRYIQYQTVTMSKMTSIIFFGVIILSHQVFSRPLVPAQLKKELLEKSGAVIRSESNEDSPQWPIRNTCPDGLLMDFLGVCREVW